MPEPEVRFLQHFLAVAEELSFTRAAGKIGIAQPALSASIGHLEEQLGVPLFIRTTRSVTLTEAGRVLKACAPGALAGLADAWAAAEAAGRGELGTLRLAYGASTSYETTPRLVRVARERYPGLKVMAEMRPTPQIAAAVLDGESDAGIARTPEPLAGTRARIVRVEPQGALMLADDPLATGVSVSLRAIGARPILVHRRGANPRHHDQLLEALATAGVHDPQLIERGPTFDPLQQVIRDGQAIGIVGASSAAGLAQDLRWIPLSEPAPRVAIALILPDRELTPAADRFERVAIAVAAQLGWLTSD